MPKRPTARDALRCESAKSISLDSQQVHEAVKKASLSCISGPLMFGPLLSPFRRPLSQRLNSVRVFGLSLGLSLGLSACADTYNTYNTYYNEEYYSVPVSAPASVFDRPATVKTAAVKTAAFTHKVSKPFDKDMEVEHMPEVVISTPLAPLKAKPQPPKSVTELSKAEAKTKGKNLSWNRKPLKLSQSFEATASGDEPSQIKSSEPFETSKVTEGSASTDQAAPKKELETHTQMASVETRAAPKKVVKKVESNAVSSKSPDSKSSGYGSHVVKKGDTSFGIASRYNMTVDKLADLNNLGADYSVFVGQTLKVQKSKTQDTAIIAPTKVKKTQENRRAALKKIKTPKRSGDKLGWPVLGKVVERHGSKPDGRYVEGVRLSTAKGTPVRAAENGVVVYRDRLTNSLKAYGQVVIIKHSGGQATVYSGISDVVTEVGTTVKRGDVIGKIGTSGELMFVVSNHKGEMTDPMLHLERRS